MSETTDKQKLTDQQVRDIARRFRYAVQAQDRIWNNFVHIEQLVGMDIDNLDDHVKAATMDMHSAAYYQLGDAIQAVKTLLEPLGFEFEEAGECDEVSAMWSVRQ